MSTIPDGRSWEQYYAEEKSESMPWYFKELDPDLHNVLEKTQLNTGRFLDLGTGPATQAMTLAKLGFEVTGSDISETAIKRAKELANENDLKIEYMVDDFLNSKIKGTFDYIFDRGCFHVFDAKDRPKYIDAVHKLLSSSGFLFLKCFSNLQEGTEGPNRLSPEEIRDCFSQYFEIDLIKNTIFQGTMDEKPKALFCVMKKLHL